MSSYTIPCYCPCLYSITYTNPHDCHIGSLSLIHCRTCTHKYTSIYNGQYHSPSQEVIDQYITPQTKSKLIHALCVLSAAAYARARAMSKRASNNNGAASSGASPSIAERLRAAGLGIQYTRMRQNAQNPHSAPFRTPTTKESYQDPIKDYKIFPGGEKPTTEYNFIKLYASVRALVEDNLREMEENYFKHTIGASSYMLKSEGDLELMVKYFKADKLGLTDISQEDTTCWKFVYAATSETSAADAPASAGVTLSSSSVSTAGGGTHTTWSSGSESTPAPASAKAGTAKKAMKTTFYNDLQNLQKKYYMFLRASVILYMDDDAQRVYKTILAEKDKDIQIMCEHVFKSYVIQSYMMNYM